MNLRYRNPQPPMQPFALALDGPGIAIGDDLSAIVWQGTGPQGVPVLVRGDGIVIFDFTLADRFVGPAVPGHQPVGGEKIPAEVRAAEQLRTKIAYQRLDYMNAWLAGYMSGMSAVQRHGIITPPPVDPINHLNAQIEESRWIAYDNNLRVITGKSEGSNIALGVFDHAIAIMNAAQKHFPDGFAATLSLFHQASFQYRTHQFASAHLTAWSLAEQALNAMWRDYQRDAATRSVHPTAIPKERKKLLNGRDFTASIITQTLSLAGVLRDDRLSKLDQARRDRNAFAHSLATIDNEAASNAMTVASEMLSDVLGMTLAPQLSNSFWI